MNLENKYCLIYTTGDSKENLEEIAASLLEKELIACANIFPNIGSIYKWENKVENSTEIAMVLKTKKEKFREVEEEIIKLHSYDCPAILEIPISQISQTYSKWLEESLN